MMEWCLDGMTSSHLNTIPSLCCVFYSAVHIVSIFTLTDSVNCVLAV